MTSLNLATAPSRSKSTPSTSTSEVDAETVAFIEAALKNGALLFGEFTLKSGRISPYFFNAGQMYTSSLLTSGATAFAKLLLSSRIPQFDVLFGPAYKGIPLAAVTTMALGQRGVEMGYAYNRKEKKDHGEGGSLVGAPLKGRIVILDDVVTSGKAIREAISIISQYPDAKLVGIAQLVDREERGVGESGKSTIQEVEEEFGVPVEAVLRMRDIMGWMEGKGMKAELEEMRKYREEYGIEQ